MILKNLLALIFIIKCLLKRFKTEGNTYSLKTLLNSISIEIYKLSFVNFLSFLKEETNNIYESIVMSFSKFNLTLKSIKLKLY